jgi:hypothetical protein
MTVAIMYAWNLDPDVLLSMNLIAESRLYSVLDFFKEPSVFSNSCDLGPCYGYSTHEKQEI